MASQETDQVCARLVQKVTSGEPLDKADKAHLAACEECMFQVVRVLDEAALQKQQAVDTSPGDTNGDLSLVRPEAKRALEHGRRVLEREFGIKLSEK
jgi:hypothetical protein